MMTAESIILPTLTTNPSPHRLCQELEVYHISLMEHHQLTSMRHLIERAFIPLGLPASLYDSSLRKRCRCAFASLLE